MSSPGIGRGLVAHQGPSLSFSAPMGERWKKTMNETFIFHWSGHLDVAAPQRTGRGQRTGKKQEKKEGGDWSEREVPIKKSRSESNRERRVRG